MRFFSVLVGLLVAVLSSHPALAQARLSGQARDARTHRPLAFASVFLTNTTYGTTTDSTGHFTLGGVPDGPYELAVSYVGYQLFTRRLTLPQAAPVLADLVPTPTQLDQVEVRPTKSRPGDFREFSKHFLGSSALSQQCRIENPDDIVVLYDKGRELVAVAPRSVRVINPALGYRIIYHSFSFKVLYKAGRIEFAAAPQFEELKSASAQQQRRWEEGRRHAYAGSLPHFLRSVRANRLAEEGFLVQALRLEVNSEEARQRAAQAADSLAEVFVPEPGLLARVYKRSLGASELGQPEDGGRRVRLQLATPVQVTYQGEQPDATYAERVVLLRRSRLLEAQQARWATMQEGKTLVKPIYEPVREVSELRQLSPEAFILPNGYLSNPLSVRVDGYWGFEKTGEALPLDYVPEPLK